MSYGPNMQDEWRRCAGYVGRILHGAKPSDLPIQRPEKFDLVINLKTAEALGVTAPTVLLATANDTSFLQPSLRQLLRSGTQRPAFPSWR
jgi:putative ABC transport system substrate-binding protein